MLIYLAVLAVVLLLVYGAWRSIGDVVRIQVRRAATRARPPRAAPGPSTYEWSRRTDQLKRQLKGVGGPEEDREGLLAFLDSHHGVEAYVEPKTAISPLSVVLVDDEGAWRRFELREDTVLRELAASHRVRIFDASKVGYPERMRRRGSGR